VRCGRPVPSSYLTVAEIRQFYAGLGFSRELADQAVERLTGRPASEYSWTEYLTRDNAAGGIEESIDGAHYAFFDILVSRMLEEAGELTPEEADAARLEFVQAAHAFTLAIRHLQVGRSLLKR
jgi:hypothetical protein